MPKRLPRAALQLAGYFHGARAFAGPTTVQVDLTDACNQSCVVCWLHAPTLAETNRDRLTRQASLPWELYLRLLDDLRAGGTEEIYFAGGGEPLAYPRAWDALREALHRGFTASLHTNFSLVDEEGVDRLIRLGVHHVTVSLWAGTREAYAATHPGTKPETFDRVVAMLKRLNERRIDRPRTKLYHVLTRENTHDAAAMLALAEEIGCDAVEWAVADVVPGATNHLGVSPEQATAALTVLRPLATRAPWRAPRALGIDAVIARLEAIEAGLAADAGLVHALPCFAGWTYSRVMADGRVIPCLKGHRVPSGNLHDASFPEIWAGARQQAFRRATRVPRKTGPYFRDIGNDPAAACGCELGCDNYAENVRTAERLSGLTVAERALLKGAALVPDAFEAGFAASRPPRADGPRVTNPGFGGVAYAGDRPEVSLVIPTHEGATEWLPECLRAVRAQVGVVPEVLIVLDGPAPTAAEIARATVPAARQLHLRENRGFAVAATAGLRAARGALIALLNDDAVPDPEWLAALVDAARRRPDAGSFASRVVQARDPDRIDSAGHGLTRWGDPFEIGHGLRDGPAFHEERPVFGAPASASAYRRELIRDCGGFDPAMEAYLEDIDLSLRAQSLGFPCLYVPTARVVHRGGASYGRGAEGDGRADRLVARNRLRVLAKSMPRAALRAGAGAAAVAIAADLALRAARGDHPTAALQGTVEGLRGLRDAAAGRGAALGARRVDDAWIADILRDSEARLQELAQPADASRARRARATLARALGAWVDRRERAISRPRW